MEEKDKIILKTSVKLQGTHRTIDLTENIRVIENSHETSQQDEN